MPPDSPRRGLRITAAAASVFTLAVLAIAGWFYGRLRSSLPQIDGPARLPGLSAPVEIERDALGVPTIRGKNRADVARGLGYAHAQDRFFQMDLLRRRAAGELAELFGKAALPADRAVRRHGFRQIAHRVLAGLPAAERSVVEAYAEGANAGLASLSAKPFEYYAIRAEPRPWLPEDTILITCAMVLTLQDDNGRYERTLDTLRDTYGDPGLAFFAPLLTPADAALDGSTAPLPPVPGPEVVDLRAEALAAAVPAGEVAPEAVVAGSNSFAVAGSRTTTGAAIIQNDMHLEMAVPNIWYRASLVWGSHRVTGVTIPGEPLVVAGSNGKVAWGFTNSQTDTGDLVRIAPSPSPDLYQGPGESGLVPFERRKETIQVKGSDPVTAEYDWTIWGPVVGTDAHKRLLAYRWTVYDPGAINFDLIAMEEAETADQAVAVAHLAGLPNQNFLVGDSAGHIAWTIAGRLPRRVGFSGRLPVSWTFGDRRWDGFLPPEEVPVVKDPPQGYLWTANNRILGGGALVLLGEGAYARPARAAQIRDDLAALTAGPKTTPADLLAVALDNRALLLERWQKLLLEVLTPNAVAGKATRAQLRAAAESWGARASVDSVGYRLVLAFHDEASRRVLEPIFEPCFEAYPGFFATRLNTEDAVWAILHARPAHLLSPKYPDWDALLLAAADDAVDQAIKEAGSIAQASWGRHNALHMQHPLSRVLPRWMTGWLNMPAEPLAGDNGMPRVATSSHGASERFAVSPGHEEQAIFEMPGGQSGHPLSPFYRAGHEAWVHGDPTPFLPGKPEHTLTLSP